MACGPCDCVAGALAPSPAGRLASTRSRSARSRCSTSLAPRPK